MNPTDPFDRLIACAAEAERHAEAEKPLALYMRGMLTVEELADRLNLIVAVDRFGVDA